LSPAATRSAPTVSAQRLRALELANEVRTARAELKKELASGKIELVQILADPVGCTNPVSCREAVFVDEASEAVSAGDVVWSGRAGGP
jgi:hypothetical protein